MTFRITFTDDDAYEGYAAGRIELADLNEIIQADLSIWSMGDYQGHWRETAEAAAVEDSLLFVTSRARTGSLTAWPMNRRGNLFVCRSRRVPPAELVFEGLRVRLRREDPDSADDNQFSRWFVIAADVAAFAARAVAPPRRLS